MDIPIAFNVDFLFVSSGNPVLASTARAMGFLGPARFGVDVHGYDIDRFRFRLGETEHGRRAWFLGLGRTFDNWGRRRG